MSIKCYTDKELEKMSKKTLISLVKVYQSQPVVTSVPVESEVVNSNHVKSNEILPDEHVRLYSKSYNNPFLGMAIKGGELYDRCSCDFVLSNGSLTYKVRYNTHVSTLEHTIPIKEGIIELTQSDVNQIKMEKLEGFIRNYFGFIDILYTKNESPFSKIKL